MNPLLNKAQLKQWSGIEQDAALIRWLDAPPSIPYKRTRGGEILTTVQAVTQALIDGKEFTDKWAA